MLIKGLLNHFYPSCKVIVYGDHGEYETTAGKLIDEVYEDEQCSDWAMYIDWLGIFM